MIVRTSLLGRCCTLVLGLLALPVLLHADNKIHWIRVSSAHFSVLTDAPEKKGREIAVRFEQMRAGFGQMLSRNKLQTSEPIEIIAFATDEGYARAAPVVQGRLIGQPAFFLPGDGRNYFVLDLAATDSWRSVSHWYAHLLLNSNYPPTQPWFDEGIAQFFSSMRLDNQQMQIGGEPPAWEPPRSEVPGHPAGAAPGPLATLLSTQAWMPLADLFATGTSKPASPLFFAQSWITLHYLIQKNKLSETGVYFGLVQLQKAPVEEAIVKAYGMSGAQLEQEIKSYFQGIASALQTLPNAAPGGPAPADGQNIGTSTQEVQESEALALVAEMMLRLPEHRQAAEQDLLTMIAAPKGENAIQHRALGWAALRDKKYDNAEAEFAQALEFDHGDFWTHYYSALTKYRAAKGTGKPTPGLPNLMQDLLLVSDADPEFAEAFNMLAMARLEGGGMHSAVDAIRIAIQLSPRNEMYTLNLATIQMAAKNWDVATQLLEKLKDSSNPEIAQTARQDLQDLPTLKKYGLLPERAPQRGAAPAAQGKTTVSSTPEADSDEEPEGAPSTQPAPDRRPIKFLKARLLHVDCTRAPSAVLTLQGTRTMKFRTADYHALSLVGAETFSCDWRDIPVAINYRAGGESDGDLVSLEIQ